MQSGFTDKITFKYTPCKEPGPCYDDDDYDPCQSSDDITEKDLAVLLKEEQLKLQKQKEKAAAAAFVKPTSEEKTVADAATTLSVAQREKARVQTKPISKLNDKTANKPSNEEVEEEKPLKKRICKKFIKNPFFTNRFKFSSDFPPPPPGPPPQLLPLVEEAPSKDKFSCLRRKRKCEKKVDDGKVKEVSTKESADVKEDVAEINLEPDEILFDKVLEEKSSFKLEEENFVKVLKSEKIIKEKTKRCEKKWEKPPCKKKNIEIPITLQPRQIPAAQKDLPETSPMLLPEVQRQFKMSCQYDCRPASSKRKCKDKNK